MLVRFRMETPATPAPEPLSSSSRRPGFRLGHRPALDGIRGVAILGVIAVHAKLVENRAAIVGVDLFFVLSGFLITTLLIEEWDQRGAISLRHFYFRRALRLLPALLVLIIVTITYFWLVNPGQVAMETTVDALIALFYSSNWALALGMRQPGVLRLAELLADHSINIARRTVTKYREMLRIGSSSERKRLY